MQPDIMRVLVAEAIRLSEVIGALDRLERQTRAITEGLQKTLREIQERIGGMMLESGKSIVQLHHWKFRLHQEENVVIDNPVSVSTKFQGDLITINCG